VIGVAAVGLGVGVGHDLVDGGGQAGLQPPVGRLTLPILVTPPLAGRLVNRGASARRLVLAAIALLAAGNAWLTVLQADSGLLVLIVPLVLIGAGNGLAAGLVDAQAMELVEPERIGMAAGLLNTARGGANALVLAVFGATLISLIQTGVGERSRLIRPRTPHTEAS
jgi:MFS family permease